jgi:hypothetical protein
MAKRDALMSELIRTRMDQEQKLAAFDEDVKRVKAMDDWNKKNVCWLDELYDMTDRFPDLKALRVTQLTCDDQPSLRGNKDKYVGRMVMKGLTISDPRPIKKLDAQFEVEKHLRAGATVAVPARGVRLPSFTKTFTSIIDVEKLPPDEFDRQIQEVNAAPKGPQRFRGPGFTPGGPRRPGQQGGGS